MATVTEHVTWTENGVVKYGVAERDTTKYPAAPPSETAFLDAVRGRVVTVELTDKDGNKTGAVIPAIVPGSNPCPRIAFDFQPITTNTNWPEYDERVNPFLNRTVGAIASLQNEYLRVEIWKEYGGCVSRISKVNNGVAGVNLINNYDLGRQKQKALYRGGRTTNNPNAHVELYWAPNGIYGYELAPDGVFRPPGTANDPIQAGSTFHNASPVLAFGMSANMIYVKVQMQNWSVENELTDVIMEQWIKLEGKVIREYTKYTHNRDWDKVSHEALQQEYPCLYYNINSKSRVAYAETTGGGITYKQDHNQTSFPIAEPWVVALGHSDTPIGLWAPNLYSTTQIQQAPGSGSGEFLNECGYTGILPILNFEWNGVYYEEHATILDSVENIRAWANSQPSNVKKFDQTFNTANDLGYWWHKKCHNVSGYPLGNDLRLQPYTNYAELSCLVFGLPASGISQIKIRMANTGSNTQFKLYFEKVNQDETGALTAGQQFNLTTTNDGQMHDYVINTGNNGAWTGQIKLLKLCYQTRNETAISGEEWRVESITTS